MAGFTFGAPAPAAATPAAAAPSAFSFGGSTPAPAQPVAPPSTATTATATTAAAAPASTFSFGAPATATATTTAAPSAPSTATAPVGTQPAAAPAASSGGAFSFAAPTASTAPLTATPPTTTAAAPSSTTSSFGFSSSSTNTNANTNANTNTNTAAANATTNINTNSSTLTATATVPTFEHSFPFLAVHTQIEHLLNSIHDQSSSNGTGNANANNDATDLLLQGQELHHLLSSVLDTNTGTSTNTGTYGQLLSNPLEALRPICNNSTTTGNKKYTPNNTLRQNLQTKPILQFPFHANDDEKNQHPTNIPSTMMNHILKLSDLLQISEMDAASLYGVILSSGGGSGSGSGSGNFSSSMSSAAKSSSSSSSSSPLEEHIIGTYTLQWFQDRHMRPNLINGFMEEVIQNAKDDGTYVKHQMNTNTATNGNVSGATTTNTFANTNTAFGATNTNNVTPTKNNANDDSDDGILQLAMDLYFTERSSCLQTLLLLIQHRVSVYSSLPPAHGHAFEGAEYEEIPLTAKIILESTDQLLKSNLIPNLISLIREMTLKNEEIGKKICTALDQQDRSNDGNQQSQNQQQQQQQQGLFGGTNTGFGGFGNMNNMATPLSAQPTANTITQVHDIDYALYEFTFRQRQVAAECLFFLTYHTQCTPSEITSLIDVVQDLTNGAIGNDSNDTGIGSGLPILDAIRDVPDPYILSWGSDSSSTSESGGSGNKPSDDDHAMQGVSMASTSMATPQHRKLEKGRVEWENELLSSLWSVRGLSNATITTMHNDFSGNRIYCATPLGAIGNDTNSASSVTAGANSGTGSNGGGSTAVIVGGGKPQLLQCVSTLMLGIVCSLDVKNTLVDRDIHGPNTFGVGNALFPPQLLIQSPTEIHDSIIGINQRLDPNSGRYSKWKRQDIVGFLSAAYALLLRPTTDVFTSPQKSPRERSSSSGSNAIYQTFRSCLETPTITKSLTFARLSLIPSVGTPSMKSSSTILDNNFSFCISVLSDFTAQYLDAISSFSDLPISRAKWMDTEQQELQVRHVQENQRRQLNAWSGQNYQEIEVPSEVDIFQRPDCLDDIIALAVNVCSACPECANRFWSTSEKIVENDDGNPDGHAVELKPSRILKKLEKLQVKDTSLLPVYLSFLGAIGLFESPYDEQSSINGATAVHKWLSSVNRITSSPNAYGDERQISWEYVLVSIRWYTQQLNPSQEEKTNDSWRTPGSMYDQTDSEDTGYYYGTNSSGNNNASRGGVNAKSSTASTTQNVKKELDRSSSLTLMSLLSLLSRVAFKSDIARRSILEIRLPVPGNKRFLTNDEDVLQIIFSLLDTSISSELKGAALCAISNLVRCTKPESLSKDNQRKDQEVRRRCWGLLEMYQLIPINRLYQYSSLDMNNSGHSFAGISSKYEHNWFPPSEQNSFIYEMEYVECKIGHYPATEGLLKLLCVLFSSSDYPSNLGSESRTMQGCNPYIEYVVDFVLPRAMGGKKGESSLYFTTPADKSRLLTRALEVVNAVLVRYMVPDCITPSRQNEPSLVSENESMTQGTRSSSSDKKGDYMFKAEQMANKAAPKSLTLVHSSIYALPDEINVGNTEYDFTDAALQSNTSGVNQAQSTPRTKSPGFYILADLLSLDGSLLKILSEILMQNHCAGSVDDLRGKRNRSNIQTRALYGDIMPYYLTTKAARDYLLEQQKEGLTEIRMSSIRSQDVEQLMLPLYPPNVQELPEISNIHAPSSTVIDSDEIIWKEHCVLLALRIICAAAGRDNSFRRCMDTAKTSSRIVPVLRFHPKNGRSIAPLLVKNIQVTGISKLILQIQSILPSLIQYIGYEPSSLTNESFIAAAAISIVNYVSENVPPRDYLRCINGMNRLEKANITISFATRLSLASTSMETDDNIKISESILKQLALDFSDDIGSNESLSHMILGLTYKSFTEKRDYLLQSFHGINVDLCEFNNVLDAMIGLVTDLNFVLEPKLSFLASKCFEIIYRLCDNQNQSFQLTKFCVISKLHTMGFWQMQMLRYLGKPEGSDSLLKLILERSPIQGNCGLDESPIIKRDSNIMHCISWILKGASLELHTLMGYSVDGGIRNNFDSSILTAMSPRPTKCRQLLRLLFGDTASIIIGTLNCLPIKKPPMAKQLLANVPHRDIVESASCMMEGPKDVCSGYQIIDPNRLMKGINEHCMNKGMAESQKDMALEWADKWNSYVNFSCASSHLCHSWYFLSQTAFTFCKSLNEGSALESRSVAETLKLALLRLNFNRNGGIIDGNVSNLSTITHKREEFEATNIYPISALCSTLVELATINEETIGDDMAQQIMFLLIGAIASCETCGGVEEVSNNERAAELCCALTALLDSKSMEGSNWFLGASSEQIRGETLRAASYIAKLSVLSSTEMTTQNHNNVQYISHVARSCLASLLSWSDQQENFSGSAGQGHFLVELFAPEAGIVAHPQPKDRVISQYIELLEKFDKTIVDLLEYIACCTRGAELLINHGLSQALVTISKKFFDDANTNHTSSTYGSVGIEVPEFVCSHFSLFNSMLSSNPPRIVRLQLIADAAQFLQIHSQNTERLLSGYPKNNELILNLVTMLCQMSSTVDEGRSVNVDLAFRRSNWFAILQRNACNLAFHLATYPLPAQFLTRLPNGLRKGTSNQIEKCWWDAVESTNNDEIVVPDPVIKSFFGGTTIEVEISNWSISKYECACSASRYIDLCLLYLINTFKDSGTISIDIPTIASAICRYSDTIQAVTSRLTTLRADGERQLSNMFSNLMDTDQEFARVQYFNNIEREILETYYTVLSTCFEKLLYLAKQKISTQGSKDNAAFTPESISLLSTAINETGITLDNGNNISFSTIMIKEIETKIREIYNSQ